MRNTPRRIPIRNRGTEDPLSDLLGDFSERLHGDRWQPAADIYETEEAVVVRLELPGVTSDQIRVNVDRDRVRVSGIRRSPDSAQLRRLHQAEIAFGPFERSVQVSTAFDRDRVTARLEDGFLEVTIPKRRPVPRRVEVETG